MRSRFGRVAIVSMLGWAAVAPGASTQRPGGGWALVPSADGQIKRLYWKESDQTEVWTRLTPMSADAPDKVPAVLIFSAIVSGDVSVPLPRTTAPDGVVLQAHANPRALVITPSLVFTTLNGRRVDLIANGMAGLLPAACDGCSSTAIQGRLDAKTFAMLATSEKTTCEVLGFRCVLGSSEAAALWRFGATIGLLPEQRLRPMSADPWSTQRRRRGVPPSTTRTATQ